MAYSLQQIMDFARQAGFTGQALAEITAIGWAESVHGTDFIGDNEQSHGIWQIHGPSHPQYDAKRLVNDPLYAAQAAFEISSGGKNLEPWTTWSGRTEAGRKANAQQYTPTTYQMAGLDPTTAPKSQGAKVATTTTATGQQAQGKLAVPKDATLYMVDGKTAFLVYDVGDGVKVRFDVNVSGTDLSGIRTQQIGGADFHRLQTVNGGDASELGSMAADFGSFGQWFDHIVQTIFPKNSPAIHDPQVRRVIGEIAARPDMTPAEIKNRLTGTTWYQGQSDQAQKYNQATDAEKLAMIGTTAADLASDWQENVGEPISPNDPRIMALARDVATGKRGRGQVLYEDIIPIARQNPESPRARTERDEQKNQLQHGNDIENQKTQVIDSFHRWGVSGDNSVFGKWAQEIADGTKSAEDLRAYLQQTAQVLYPWKDPNTETLDAAQPWMSTYRRVLERDPAGLEDPILQQALNSGTPLYQFEKDLKGRSEWLYTKNARDDVEKTFSEVGSIMGFN